MAVERLKMKQKKYIYRFSQYNHAIIHLPTIKHSCFLVLFLCISQNGKGARGAAASERVFSLFHNSAHDSNAIDVDTLYTSPRSFRQCMAEQMWTAPQKALVCAICLTDDYTAKCFLQLLAT